MKKKNGSYIIPALLILYGIASLIIYISENAFQESYGFFSLFLNPLKQLGLAYSAFWFAVFLNAGIILSMVKRMS